MARVTMLAPRTPLVEDGRPTMNRTWYSFFVQLFDGIFGESSTSLEQRIIALEAKVQALENP